jgi:nicotinamidase-related amidase
MRSILITQCVQNDFVRPLAAGEALPNLVHIGRMEAERLHAPLADFLTLAHAVDPEKLAIVHVGDAHDPKKHAAHFDLFRAHCIAGSDGAQFVAPIPTKAKDRANTHTLSAGDLNDFEDSTLQRVLGELCNGDAKNVRVGVVGVWTDAKISFLLYDLCTRLRAGQLATCSALTASRSIDAHFRALESLQTLLGVNVFHAAGEFLEWLAPGQASTKLSATPVEISYASPPQSPSGWTAEHEAECHAILGRLRLESADGNRATSILRKEELKLQQLGGGFSGAQVFIGRCAGEAPRIYKVGARGEIARERFGNERVRRVLGDVVPRLLAWHEGSRLAGMKLELAECVSSDQKGPATFKSLYESDASDSTTMLLEATLDAVLDAGLGRFYRTAEKDNADLLEIYGFTDRHARPQFADSIARKADAIAAKHGFADAAALLKDAKIAGPWLEPKTFYTQWLPGRSLTREIFPSLVHGDLNLANILLSWRPNAATPDRVWVIDFARLSRLPNLTDFAKIENDLTYIMMPVSNAAEFETAQRIQDARLAGPGLDVPNLAQLGQTSAQKRYCRLIARLRSIAAKMDGRGPAAMDEYRLALLRYAAHTLGFDEPTSWQLRLSLLACAQLCGRISS